MSDTVLSVEITRTYIHGFHFIIFLASNELSRALRVFQKLAEGLWKPYPDPARLALFEREPAPS